MLKIWSRSFICNFHCNTILCKQFLSKPLTKIFLIICIFLCYRVWNYYSMWFYALQYTLWLPCFIIYPTHFLSWNALHILYYQFRSDIVSNKLHNIDLCLFVCITHVLYCINELFQFLYVSNPRWFFLLLYSMCSYLALQRNLILGISVVHIVDCTHVTQWKEITTQYSLFFLLFSLFYWHDRKYLFSWSTRQSWCSPHFSNSEACCD